MEDPNEIVKKLFDDVDVCINVVEKALPSIIMEQYAREAALFVDSMPKNTYYGTPNNDYSLQIGDIDRPTL